MKTPEEMKKGLAYCMNRDCAGVKCPYYNAVSCNTEKTRDALVYIQDLESRVPRWISVEERLPEQGAMALCYTRKYIEVLQWDGKAGLWFGLGTINGKGYVTHWMPLPEPPKEE